MLSLMLPFGSLDCGQRREYLATQVEALSQVGATIGGEAKGTLGDWADETIHFIKDNGGSVSWHVPYTWVSRIGFPKYDLEELIRNMSVALPYLANGVIDALVLHLGLMRWIEEIPMTEIFAERYISPFPASAILEQIDRHLERYARLVEIFGHDHIILENTPITFARVIPDPQDSSKKTFVHGLAPQIGTAQTALYVARMLGVGNVLDTGHFSEERAFLLRQSDFHVLPGKPKPNEPYVQPPISEVLAGARLRDIAGYYLSERRIPWADHQPELAWMVTHVPYRLFHLDASRASLVGGKLDCELPILDPGAAQRVALDDIIRVARANPDCLGLAIENVGIDEWTFATDRPNDWEGKQGTFEYILKQLTS